MAAAVSLISGQSLFDSFGFAFDVLWGLTLLVFLGTWLYGRANAGRVLLDSGPIPMRGLFLILAGGSLILGLTDEPAAASVSKAFAISRPVFDVSFAAFLLIIATGRLQVRKNGIWRYCSILRWGKIGSYHWANDTTLVVRQKGPLAFFKGALPVSPEHRQAVEGFLTERCSATRTN
jgi:hypothetical protein